MGTARVVTAAERITEALGFVIELAVAELAAELVLDAEEAAGEMAGEPRAKPARNRSSPPRLPVDWVEGHDADSAG